MHKVLLAVRAKFCDTAAMSTSLDTEVRAALEQRKGEWQTVAKASGVSYSWISKFVNGHIPNPGFATLKQLNAYLSPVESPEAKAA